MKSLLWAYDSAGQCEKIHVGYVDDESEDQAARKLGLVQQAEGSQYVIPDTPIMVIFEEIH